MSRGQLLPDPFRLNPIIADETLCIHVSRPAKTPYRSGAAGADSLIHSLSDHFVQNHQDTVYPKPYELGSKNFERTVAPPPCVTCHLSDVTHQVSYVFFS